MNKKARKPTGKATAFWAAFWSLNALYMFTAVVAKESLPSIGTTIVICIAAAGGIYQAANVVDNGVKGKFYRAELDARKESRDERKE